MPDINHHTKAICHMNRPELAPSMQISSISLYLLASCMNLPVASLSPDEEIAIKTQCYNDSWSEQARASKGGCGVLPLSSPRCLSTEPIHHMYFLEQRVAKVHPKQLYILASRETCRMC